EMVDEAKAFCPGCGHSVLDEKRRTTVSDFERSDHTVSLCETMYNQMLTDMGLNISKVPKRDEKNTQVVPPLAPAVTAPSADRKEQSSPTPAHKRRSRIIQIDTH